MDISVALRHEIETQEGITAERLRAKGRAGQVEWCKNEITQRTKVQKFRFKDKQIGEESIDGPTWSMIRWMTGRYEEGIDKVVSYAKESKPYYRVVCGAVAQLRKNKLDVPRQVEELILDVATGIIRVKGQGGRPKADDYRWAVCNCIDFLNYRLGVRINDAIEMLAEATGKEFATIEEYWKKKEDLNTNDFKLWRRRRDRAPC